MAEKDIKPILVDGEWWNSVFINGRLYLLTKLGKLGDRIRP